MFKALTALFLLATVPSSSNYVLNAYDFGNGAATSSGSTYSISGSAGSIPGSGAGSTYALPAGIKASITVPVPAAPTFTNASSNYDRLKLTLSVGSDPSDTKYLIAISDDGFTTTKYVQTDNTIGTNLALTNYQTYSAWGGASGFSVLGLTPGTTYTVKVAALQGSYTGSAFGPTASASTVQPSVTFSLSTNTTTFASLPAGSVTTAGTNIVSTITTNALSGGALTIQDQYGGLKSTAANYTLPSATADLTAASSGYGAQVTAVSQSSGGPVSATSPFNGTGNNVGLLSTNEQNLAGFSSAVTSGSVTTALLAKTNITVPSASDYADTITMSLSLLF